MTDFQQIAVKHFEKDVCFFKFTQKLCVLVMGPVEGVRVMQGRFLYPDLRQG